MATVRELKEYCNKNKPHCILFHTENQEWYAASDPCKLKMSFPIMLICENPNLICLKSGVNTLTLDQVKFVEINTEATVLGTVFKVFCGSFDGTNGYDTTYTLIAS